MKGINPKTKLGQCKLNYEYEFKRLQFRLH